MQHPCKQEAAQPLLKGGDCIMSGGSISCLLLNGLIALTPTHSLFGGGIFIQTVTCTGDESLFHRLHVAFICNCILSDDQ